MEPTMPCGVIESASARDQYELEAELSQAERRYALARGRSRRALEECHAVEADIDARLNVAKLARERYEALELKCQQLQQLIEELEER